MNVFSSDLASKLPKHTEINNHFIELINANGFIKLSKSPAGAPIFFNQKSNESFKLNVDYKSLNNLTMAISVLQWPIQLW